MLVMAACFTTSLPLTGCSTTSGGGTNAFTSTNTVLVVSNFMVLTVSEAVAYGLKQDAATTTNAANATAAVINEFAGGTDFTPGALETALQQLPVSILQTPVAGVIINAIESTYQIYWGSDVSGAINGDFVAKSYLGAVTAGITKGESGTVVPLLGVKRPPVRVHGSVPVVNR